MIEIPRHKIDRALWWSVACDLAVTAKQSADASALRPFARDYEGNLYLGPLVHLRDETPQIVEQLCSLCDIYQHKNDPATISLYIEKGPITNSILPQLQSRILEKGLTVSIVPVHMPGDKAAKARVLQAQMQLGRVYHTPGPMFETVELPEYLGFQAGGKHDDIVDVDALAAYVINKGIVPAPPDEPAKAYERPDEHSLTYEQMRARCQPRKDREERRHVPLHIDGRIRSPRKGTPGYKQHENMKDPWGFDEDDKDR